MNLFCQGIFKITFIILKTAPACEGGIRVGSARREFKIGNVIPTKHEPTFASVILCSSNNDNNFVNEPYLFTQISTITKTYTTNGARTVYI